MPLSLDLPHDVQQTLQSHWSELQQPLRESLAIEGYRRRVLSLAQVRRLLGLATRWDAQSFLGRKGIAVFDFDPAELDAEAEANRRADLRETGRPE